MRACQTFVRIRRTCEIRNQSGEKGFNRNARLVQELPRGMCVTTKPGHTP